MNYQNREIYAIIDNFRTRKLFNSAKVYPRYIHHKKQKDQVSVLLLEIMKKILVSGSEKKLKLIQLTLKEMNGGHILFNFIDPEIQSITKKYKIRGKI